MQMQAFNQVALLVPTTVASTNVGACSWSTTSTIAATAATYTSAPCPTVTGSFMVAKDMEGAFELHGIEEIQGNLVINGATKLDRIDLGDLQKVDGLHISNIRVDRDGMSWPKLHTAKRIDWYHLQLFDGRGSNNPKITGVENLNLYNTTINDLSDVFDIEAGGYIFVAANANMENVTLPNLKSVGIALEIFDNAPSATISFPELEAAESIVVSQIGRGAGGAAAEATTSPSSSLDLPKLVEVHKDFTIGDSPGLAAVNAPALTRVRGDLKVVNNSRLRTMPFESLGSVDGDLLYNGSFDA
ncbi:cell wall protein Ecm33 [Diplodia seriata]|uniref:Cell wall protein Ecm33 n=1 Tax=Diplodia seriata TaxID=420778 RepID=A0ABR3CFL9_9PEZI